MNSKPVDFAPGRAEKKVIVQRGRHRPRWLHEPRERQLNSVFSLRPPIRSQKYFRGGFACGDCRHCLRVCGQPNLAPGSGAHAKLFPAKNNHAATAATNTTPAVLSPAQLRAAQIKENGLQLVDGSQAAKLFRDPRLKQNIVVFIDARDESHYQEGHIPGACEFDPYHPDKYFAAILPLCRAAEQIVVYCNGGDCDDSETAAILLRNVGIANRKLFIYGGGITEWTNDGLPVETGVRTAEVCAARTNEYQPTILETHCRDIFTVLARWLLGAAFLYLGLNKALHPVDF